MLFAGRRRGLGPRLSHRRPPAAAPFASMARLATANKKGAHGGNMVSPVLKQKARGERAFRGEWGGGSPLFSAAHSHSFVPHSREPAYGVGSRYEPPKMSEFPKLGRQSCCGAGLGTLVSPVSCAFRHASSAGQSAALRVSFQTAAP